MDDPRPSSSSAPDPSPLVPGEEGDRWVLVPATDVEGADAPKVFHWEDLQQELARLWSLSAALASVTGRKASLAARLDSALEVLYFWIRILPTSDF
jgi:UV radiation resistance-associated gene protein